jgi:two-component system C4-dicarboxylate transport response regulator DctD
VIDCSAIPADHAETELFGETGATDRASPFELATGGTLLLDELVDMPVEQQIKLLRVLEEREVQRVGDNHPRPFDVRLISAANEAISSAMDQGRFRSDLYFRLNTIEIHVPPLRERADDVTLLFEHFTQIAADAYGRELPSLTARDLAALRSHAWPGNVRELKNLADRSVLYHGEPIAQLLTSTELAPDTGSGNRKLVEAVQAFEKSLVEQALERAKGDMAQAAEALGLPRRTLSDKLQRHEIDRDRYKPG